MTPCQRTTFLVVPDLSWRPLIWNCREHSDQFLPHDRKDDCTGRLNRPTVRGLKMQERSGIENRKVPCQVYRNGLWDFLSGARGKSQEASPVIRRDGTRAFAEMEFPASSDNEDTVKISEDLSEEPSPEEYATYHGEESALENTVTSQEKSISIEEMFRENRPVKSRAFNTTINSDVDFIDSASGSTENGLEKRKIRGKDDTTEWELRFKAWAKYRLIRSLYRVSNLLPFYVSGPISSTFISTNIINGSKGFGRWHENQATTKNFWLLLLGETSTFT